MFESFWNVTPLRPTQKGKHLTITTSPLGSTTDNVSFIGSTTKTTPLLGSNEEIPVSNGDNDNVYRNLYMPMQLHYPKMVNPMSRNILRKSLPDLPQLDLNMTM